MTKIKGPSFHWLQEIIRERRAIYPNQFNDIKVPDEWVNQILENANWAPNHRRTEPWRFHVLTGEKKKELSEFAANWLLRHTKGEVPEINLKKVRTYPLLSSHVIIICMQRDPEESVPRWEEEAAVACAMQNLWLSASSLGLGGYWSTPKYRVDIGELIELQEGEECLGLFFLGVPKEGIVLPDKRNPIEEKVKWYP